MNDMTKMDDRETLRWFTIRARRVQAHSIARDEKELVRLAQGDLEATIDATGQVIVTRHLPADEEVFESLASRVRPFMVQSEPIFYKNVLDSIGRLIENSGIDEHLHARLRDLQRAWDATNLQGTQTQAYSIQSIRLDGTDPTNVVSDTQLAAAWLYADLVHADAHGSKKEALEFPLRERYAAAVRVFSCIAVLTGETLQLVEALRDAGILTLDNSAWEEAVSIGASELVHEARAYVAPLRSEVPDIRDPSGLPKEWSPLTITELCRQDPANHVRVVLQGSDDAVVATYDAAVVHRHHDTSNVEWEVLVAHSVMLKLSFDVRDNQATNVRCQDLKVFDSSNELKLSSLRFFLHLHDSNVMVLEVEGGELSFSVSAPVREDVRLGKEALAETLEDIVKIERLTKQILKPCSGDLTGFDRIRLRQTRLLWEGHVVHVMLHSLTVIAAEDEPPQFIGDGPGTFDVGGTNVPSPRTYMRHPAMKVIKMDSDSQVEAGSARYRIELPPGEQFFAWVPGLADVSGDEDLKVTAPWGLLGVDEAIFRG